MTGLPDRARRDMGIGVCIAGLVSREFRFCHKSIVPDLRLP
jgi:hypothetical protein